MSDERPPRPPFDGLRAAFFFVAIMYAWQAAILTVAVVFCVTVAYPEIIAGKFQCDRDGKLSELMQSMLTSALAFALAFINRDKGK